MTIVAVWLAGDNMAPVSYHEVPTPTGSTHACQACVGFLDQGVCDILYKHCDI